MTSHHDVAVVVEALRVNTCRYAHETEEAAAKRRIATDLEAANLLESQAKALSEARAKLFPYADATEISGMSWSGFYLIGDKKSIRELKRLEHRSAQLEAFSKEYDLRTEALEAHVQAAEARLADLEAERDDMTERMNRALGKADYEAERAGNIENECDELKARLAEAMKVIEPFAKGWWTHQNPKAKVSVVFNHNPYDERDLCTVGDIHAARAFTNVAKEKT